MYNISDTSVEKHFVSTMYACYADILFVVFPFVLVGLLRFWNGEFNILMHPDISIATVILAGMSIGKLLISLISDKDLKRFKVRFAFFISFIIFIIFGPSLTFIIMVIDGHTAPKPTIFIQPLLFVLTIIIYSFSFNISFLMNKWLERTDEQATGITKDDNHNFNPSGPT